MNTLLRNTILSEDFMKLPSKAGDKICFWQCKHISNIALAAPIKIDGDNKEILIIRVSGDFKKIKAAIDHGIKFTYIGEADLRLIVDSIALTQ